MVANGLIEKSLHVDACIWAKLLLLPGTWLIRRIVIIAWLLLGNLGTGNGLGCVVDAVAALHPILLTTPEVRVVHFINWHNHDVGIRVALILGDLRVGLILREASVEERFAIRRVICLFLVAIEI